MNHLAIKHVLEEAERYTPEYSKQLGIRYKAIEQDGKQYEWPDSYMENQKLLARHGLFEDLNLDYDSEELEKAMEEADKRLERHGAATEARAIVSVIDSHRETFDLIAPPMARKLYEEFCLLAEPQPVAEPQHDHFNSTLTDEQLTTIFERLKGKYIAADSDRETWLYICKGGDLDGDFQLIKWQQSAGLLALMVDKLFSGDNRKWAKTVDCFCKEDGTRYKDKDTFSQALSRYKRLRDKGDTDGGTSIDGEDELLRLLEP